MILLKIIFIFFLVLTNFFITKFLLSKINISFLFKDYILSLKALKNLKFNHFEEEIFNKISSSGLKLFLAIVFVLLPSFFILIIIKIFIKDILIASFLALLPFLKLLRFK